MIATLISILNALKSARYRDRTPSLPIAIELAEALKHVAPKSIVYTRDTDRISHTWIVFKDEKYPLTVDIIGQPGRIPEKLVYLLPGTGADVASSFFYPENKSLARHLVERGYLAIGITPRENACSKRNAPFMADWGIRKHTADVRKIVEIVQKTVPLPYELLGHSSGAAYVAYYASLYSTEIERATLLDLGICNPANREEIANQEKVRKACVELISQGKTRNTDFSTLRFLVLIASVLPKLNSGYSRSAFGQRGSFTFEGLLHAALIWSSKFPTFHTPLSKISDVSFIRGNVAGTYDFADDPKQDKYSLTVSDLKHIRKLIFRVANLDWPSAIDRDWSEINLGHGDCAIKWDEIKTKVLWINSEYGFGSKQYGADLIRKAGNQNVATHVLTGYAHGDVVFSAKASEDLWPLITN